MESVEYRRKGVFRLEFMLEISLAFAGIPLHFCRCSPLIILNFSAMAATATTGRVRRIPATNIAHTVSFSIQTLLSTTSTVTWANPFALSLNN